MPNCHICGKSDLSMLCVCGECVKPSWIPVTERLPDNGYALACCSSGNRVTTFFWAGRSDDLEKAGYKVTHWMLLPKPPEGGEG